MIAKNLWQLLVLLGKPAVCMSFIIDLCGHLIIYLLPFDISVRMQIMLVRALFGVKLNQCLLSSWQMI